jgi:hypothetical protein
MKLKKAMLTFSKTKTFILTLYKMRSDIFYRIDYILSLFTYRVQ